MRKVRGVGKRAVGHVGPGLVVTLHRRPQGSLVTLRKSLNPPVVSLERDRSRWLRGSLIDRQTDRLAGRWMRFRFGGHGDRFFRSSRKNPLVSGCEAASAKASKRPSPAS